MKKYLALFISAIIILATFAGCKKAETIKTADNKEIPAVTQENGGVIRDEAGNLIVYVTEANGNLTKGEDGEYVTTPVALERPIVVGRRVEAPLYSINIPNGWSDKLTVTDLDIIRDGTKDNLRIAIVKDADMNKTLEQRTSVVNIAKNNYPTAESANKKIALENGIEAQYMYTWVDDTGVREDDGKGNLTVISSFIGFIVFEYKGDIYSCNLSSNQNMNEDIDEIIDILNTIEFIKK